jgi:hypothetical protein
MKHSLQPQNVTNTFASFDTKRMNLVVMSSNMSDSLNEILVRFLIARTRFHKRDLSVHYKRVQLTAHFHLVPKAGAITPISHTSFPAWCISN